MRSLYSSHISFEVLKLDFLSLVAIMIRLGVEVQVWCFSICEVEGSVPEVQSYYWWYIKFEAILGSMMSQIKTNTKQKQNVGYTLL